MMKQILKTLSNIYNLGAGTIVGRILTTHNPMEMSKFPC